MRTMILAAASVALLALPACATTATGDDLPRVVLETDAGRMVVELELERAPLTVCNFLSYVTDGDYAGGSFFRTVVSATNDNPNPIDVIQAATPRGSDDDSRPSIYLERSRDTGLGHLAGTISMARDGPDTATSSFFIVTRDTPSLDFGGGRNPDGQGFAAFGRLVEGLDVAQRIQMSPADAEEQLTPPVAIRSATLIGEVPPGCRP
ncbi:peptidylprolyl isomerase [Brevundimonas sp.]|uniref:peptidylprolyl isomerase n=1 Tax=Brevundimonas sp. TaxID=1871086 RepID=UPI00272EEAE3|nr:peptidylprolyl isomerase [Brevundimonas sp.]MDP1911809.1 peptidylprolyl isomerase [Brevundimonas sp.]